FEFGVLLAAFGPTRDHGLAPVVRDRTFEDGVGACDELRLDVVGVLARRFRNGWAIGRYLHDLLLQPAPIKVRDGLARQHHLDEFWIERFPVPLGAREIGLWRKRRLIDMIAA